MSPAPDLREVFGLEEIEALTSEQTHTAVFCDELGTTLQEARGMQASNVMIAIDQPKYDFLGRLLATSFANLCQTFNPDPTSMEDPDAPSSQKSGLRRSDDGAPDPGG